MNIMALVKCPECEKQISDKATKCPNCGYKIPHPEKIEAIKKYAKLCGICLLALVVVIVLYKVVTKVHTPFEKFRPQMTKEEVHKKLGKPHSTSSEYDSEYNIDYYYQVSFVGLNGELSIWYRDDSEESIGHIYWEYELTKEENFSDYSKQIDKINEIFTEKYGSPSEGYGGTTVWEDLDGQEYRLELDSNSQYSALPPSIKILYIP